MINVITQIIGAGYRPRLEIESYLPTPHGAVKGYEMGKEIFGENFITLGFYKTKERAEEVCKMMDAHIDEIRRQEIAVMRGIDIPITSIFFEMPKE